MLWFAGKVVFIVKQRENGNPRNNPPYPSSLAILFHCDIFLSELFLLEKSFVL